MNLPAKIGLGIAAFSPFPLVALFFGGFFYIIAQHPNDFERFFLEHQLSIYLFNALNPILFAGIELLFLIHVSKNPRIAEDRVKWILGLLILFPFVVPFYWYQQIWKEGRRSEMRIYSD